MRRSFAPPRLSLAVPWGQSDGVCSTESTDGKQDMSAVAEQKSLHHQAPLVPSLHKQVKFLAPDDQDEDSSEQSSICQSPSWEGYTVKRREKKLEVERMRRESREARKNLATRLSKTPPSMRHTSAALALAKAECSLSDPTLPTRHSTVPRTHSLASHAEEQVFDAVRLVSFDAALRTRPPVSLEAEPMDRPSHHSEESVSFTGKIDAAQGSGDQPRAPKTLSTRPDVVIPSPVPVRYAPVRDAPSASSWLPRDSCPPPASRTPLMRSQAEIRPGPGRSNSFLRNAVKIFKGRDARSRTTTCDSPDFTSSPVSTLTGEFQEGGRQPESYVGCQRGRSTERAMAGLVDDPVAASALQHSRRPSLTQEAIAFAMRLAGKKQAAAKSVSVTGHTKSAGSVDRDNFIAMQTSPSGLTLLNPDGMLPSTRYDAIPLDPAPSSYGKGTFLDAAHRPSQSPASVPSFHLLRAKLHAYSSFSAPPSRDSRAIPVSLHRPVQIKPKEGRVARNTPGSHLSDTVGGNESGIKTGLSLSVKKTSANMGVGSPKGSTSSSAYDDASPPTSPVTTPDTSRPQSSGDVPLHVGQGSQRTRTRDVLVAQTLETRRRDVAESVQEKDGQCTRSIDRTEAGGSPEGSPERIEEDWWSRTAQPVEVDVDAQSFVTSLSHLDQTDAVRVGMPPHLVPWSSADHADVVRTSREEPRQNSGREVHRQSKLRKKKRAGPKEQKGTPQNLAPSHLTGAVPGSGFDSSLGLHSNSILDTVPVSSDSGLLSCVHRAPREGVVPSPGVASHRLLVQSNVQAKTNSTPTECEMVHEPLGKLPCPVIPCLAKTCTASFAARMEGVRGPCQAPASMTAVPRVTAPVSILKQRSPGPPVPPGLPAMQPPPVGSAPTETRSDGAGAALTKIFVECCSCRFFHDMPSKVYKYMIHPDAVVEDHTRGISGAITTRVKCPWCQHEMSKQCCAGYAALVFLEEKLH